MLLSLKHAVTKHRARSIFPYSSSSSGFYDSVTPNDVADSFKAWFKTRTPTTHPDPLLTRIFQTLSSPSFQNDAAFDARLSTLPIPPLSESFVLRVLRFGSSNGHVLPCIRFFDWAGRQPNFHHTRGTFAVIFRILSRASLMPLVLEFLSNFYRGGRPHRVRFNDTLVIGYAVAGKPEIALQVFGKMRFQGLDLDRYAYHVLLNAIVEENYFNAFDVINKQIRMRGYDNQFTNALVVKSLCKQGKLDEAEGFLFELVNGGKELHGCEVSVLVGALCKGNRFDHAVRLVREFGDSGLVPLDNAYGVWIRGLVKGGRLDEALEFFKEKRDSRGYVPSLFRYNVLICKLLTENRLGEVYDLLMDMKETEVPPNVVTMNAILCFFCKAGMVDIALNLYNSRSMFELSPNHMAYKCLILTLCWEGNIREAFGVLKSSIEHGYFPDQRTFNILANALCREGKTDEMKELLYLAESRNYMPSPSTFDRYITALCQAGKVEEGYVVHGDLKNVHTRRAYTRMIMGFKKKNKGNISARLLAEMKAKGHKVTRPLCRTVICCLLGMDNSRSHFFNLLEMLSRNESHCSIYNCFIDGAGHAKKAELAREVFELMHSNCIEPNISSQILMLQAYLRSGRVSDALNFFNSLRTSGTVTKRLYNALIVGLCKCNKEEIASEFLFEMINCGFTPSIECYENLVLKLCSLYKYHEAIYLINLYEKTGRRLTAFLGNVLLFHSLASPEVYITCVRLRGVKEGETSGSSLLTSIVGEFCGRLRVDACIEDLEEQIAKCFPLDIYTYNLLLRKASRSDMGQACELFGRMIQKGYKPNRWTYDIMVHGFSKGGRKDEAKRWVEEMFEKGYYPSEKTRMII